MLTYNPQQEKLKYIGSCNSWIKWLLITYFILSFDRVAEQIFKYTTPDIVVIIIFILKLIILVAILILNVFVKYILFPSSLNIKRNDFLDNSLNSNFHDGKRSANYFDNEEIPYGYMKLGFNLYENIYFSFSILNKMFLKKFIINSVALCFVIIMIALGFKHNEIYLLVLNLLLSSIFFDTLINLISEKNRLKTIRAEYYTIVSKDDFKKNIVGYIPNIMKTLMEYETSRAHGISLFNDKIYKMYNDKLTSEFNEIKKQLFDKYIS